MEFAQQQTSRTTAASAMPPPNTIDIDAKILSDLNTVNEKINLCQSMLVNIHSTTEIDSNDLLLSVIGFLEACVPRIRELIDVGMTALKEETLTKCFQVNDDLCKILDDVEHPETVLASVATTAPAAPKAATKNVESNNPSNDILDSLEFDAFGFEDKKRAVADDDDDLSSAKASTSPKATSVLEDLLAPPSAVPAVVKTPEENNNDVQKDEDGGDGFDDFVGKRVSKSNSFSIDE